MVSPPVPNPTMKPVTDDSDDAVQPMPATEESPKALSSRNCKCLFGRPSPDVAKQIETLTKEAIAIEQRRFKRRWNFDADAAYDWQDDAVDNNVDAVLDIKMKTLSKQPQVSVNLSDMATNFKWQRIDNENIPYFYYKPYGGAADPFRPLTCLRDGQSVPGTPQKRRYEETDVYKTRSNVQTPKNSENSTLSSPTRTPAARRLNFSFGKPASSTPPTRKITSADIRQALEVARRNRTTSKSSPTSSPSASAPSSSSKSPAAATNKTPGKDRTKSKPTKNVEESPKSQVLITAMMFKKKVLSPSRKSPAAGESCSDAETSSTSSSPRSGRQQHSRMSSSQ